MIEVNYEDRYFKEPEFDHLYKDAEYLRLLTLSVDELDAYNKRTRDAVYEHRAKEVADKSKSAALKVLKEMERETENDRNCK